MTATDPGPDRRERGGAQVIPRPASITPGQAPPWADLDASRRIITMAAVRAAMDSAPAPLASPVESRGVRASAVLVPVYEEDGEVNIVLTRRAQHMRSHRGEVSFPGGGQEPGEDLRTTALRESCEEIGLDPGHVEVIGELDHLQTVTSQSFIVPYVGVLADRPVLEANTSEVELILHVPLRVLLDPAVFREELWGVPPMSFSVQFFEIPGDTIWGATGRMLRNFLGLVTGTGWRDEEQRWGPQHG